MAFSIVTSLLAPLCYVALFFLVDKALLIPYVIVKHCCKNIGALHGFKGDKIIGLLLGFILSVGIVFTAFMPLSGYARFAEEATDLLERQESETEQKELQELASVADSPLLVADSVCGGEALFYVCAKDLKVSMETVETIVLALDYFDGISAGGLTTVLAVAKLALIFDDLSPEAARILNDILCEVGTETDILEDTIAATVGQVFIAFAEMSGELTKAEATQEFASVNYMLTNLILDRETKVNEYIEMIGHSKVISKVIVEAANPESSNHIVAQTIVEMIADVDKAEIKEAMDKFYNMYLKNTEVLNAIAQLLEIDAQY